MQDSISMLQTAERGMEEIHALLQRGRELSVQAKNDTLQIVTVNPDRMKSIKF